jgi:predicted secreted Zn-dependent protease
MTFRNSFVALSFAVEAVLVAVPQAGAEPKLTETIVTYDVTGATPAAVRANIDKLGPFGERENRRVHALTKWSVRWGFLAADTAKGCDVADVVTMSTPRLRCRS